MKVGTDAMLLGSWAQPCTPALFPDSTSLGSTQHHHLDIGTGTGILALMLAQAADGASSSIIHAVDVDGEACQQAAENAARSPWTDRVLVFHAGLQQLLERADDQQQQQQQHHQHQHGDHCRMEDQGTPPQSAGVQREGRCPGRALSLDAWRMPPGGYSTIVCNPPYFVNSPLPAAQGTASTPKARPPGDAAALEQLGPDVQRRALARHAGVAGEALTHEQLAEGAARLLAWGGSLYVVLPVDAGEAERFTGLAASAGLTLVSELRVYATENSPREKRRLMRFTKSQGLDAAAGGVSSQRLSINVGDASMLARGMRVGQAFVPTREYMRLTFDYHDPAFFERMGVRALSDLEDEEEEDGVQ